MVNLQASVDFWETKQNHGTTLACSQKLELRVTSQQEVFHISGMLKQAEMIAKAFW
jgi:hypothetical protein